MTRSRKSPQPKGAGRVTSMAASKRKKGERRMEPERKRRWIDLIDDDPEPGMMFGRWR